MSQPLQSLPQDRLSVVYDGECPFCSRYVTMTRLKASAGAVELIDARSRPDVVAEMRARDLDINDGMLVQHRGRTYFGGDALHILALLSSRSQLFNRLTASVMSNEWLVRTLYPLLRAGRNTTLRIMGRELIH